MADTLSTLSTGDIVYFTSLLPAFDTYKSMIDSVKDNPYFYANIQIIQSESPIIQVTKMWLGYTKIFMALPVQYVNMTKKIQRVWRNWKTCHQLQFILKRVSIHTELQYLPGIGIEYFKAFDRFNERTYTISNNSIRTSP